MRMEGRVALVTGGGRGIGRAIVEKLSAEGAQVAVADIDGPSAARAAAAIRESGREAFEVTMDVTDRDSVIDGVTTVTEHYGRIDVLVNNAGWDKVEPFLRSDEATWEKVLKIGRASCRERV